MSADHVVDANKMGGETVREIIAAETGGPAFPDVGSGWDRDSGQYFTQSSGGMTMRDYFAAKAMAALLANPNKEGCNRGAGGLKTFPGYAYEWADAMLKARTE